MAPGRRIQWARAVGAVCGGGILLQTAGCAIDPDLLLQAFVQFVTELAIFAVDNAAVGLR